MAELASWEPLESAAIRDEVTVGAVRGTLAKLDLAAGTPCPLICNDVGNAYLPRGWLPKALVEEDINDAADAVNEEGEEVTHIQMDNCSSRLVLARPTHGCKRLFVSLGGIESYWRGVERTGVCGWCGDDNSHPSLHLRTWKDAEFSLIRMVCDRCLDRVRIGSDKIPTHTICLGCGCWRRIMVDTNSPSVLSLALDVCRNTNPHKPTSISAGRRLESLLESAMMVGHSPVPRVSSPAPQAPPPSPPSIPLVLPEGNKSDDIIALDDLAAEGVDGVEKDTYLARYPRRKRSSSETNWTMFGGSSLPAAKRQKIADGPVKPKSRPKPHPKSKAKSKKATTKKEKQWKVAVAAAAVLPPAAPLRTPPRPLPTPPLPIPAPSRPVAGHPNNRNHSPLDGIYTELGVTAEARAAYAKFVSSKPPPPKNYYQPRRNQQTSSSGGNGKHTIQIGMPVRSVAVAVARAGKRSKASVGGGKAPRSRQQPYYYPEHPPQSPQDTADPGPGPFSPPVTLDLDGGGYEWSGEDVLSPIPMQMVPIPGPPALVQFRAQKHARRSGDDSDIESGLRDSSDGLSLSGSFNPVDFEGDGDFDILEDSSNGGYGADALDDDESSVRRDAFHQTVPGSFIMWCSN